MSEMSILFLGKKDDEHCISALNFLKKNFNNVEGYLGGWGEPLPEALSLWNGDYIVSYLSRWIVPEWLIKKANIGAINFHAASPRYPGMGCINFALYENADEYGATCHHMSAKVDTGKIIAVKKFPIYRADDVDSLLSRTYDFQLTLFYEIVDYILKGDPLPTSSEQWSRLPFTRKDMEELYTLTPMMDEAEIKRRIRATSFGAWQPGLILHGCNFRLSN